MSATKEQRTWQDKLAEALKLKGQAGLAAYKRGSLLTEVFDDRTWRERVALVDDDKAMAVLDDYVEDLCLTFAELRAMTLYYPNREVWGQGKLRTLYVEMRDAQRAAGKLPDDERPHRNGPIARKVFEAVVEEAASRERKVSQLTETLDEERSEVARLRSENANLREQLAEARGRISQLEKTLSRELAAA